MNNVVQYPHTKRCVFLWKMIKSHNKTQKGFVECDCRCHVFPNNFRKTKEADG